MKVQEIILPVVLAFVITMGFNYYFSGPQQAPEQGQVLSGATEIAPRATQDMRPISTEIDFVDEHPVAAQETVVNTAMAELTFTTAGAVLSRLEYKHTTGKITKQLIAYQVASHERERRAFLLALDEKTPYNYILDGVELHDETTVLRYHYALTPATTLRKTFIVHTHTCRIDLQVQLEGAPLAAPTRMRLVLPSPHLEGLAEDPVRVVANKSDEVALYSNLKEASNLLWRIPTLFGLDDRYFVLALIHNEHKAIQKAFLRFDNPQAIAAFLETGDVQQPTTIETSFYVGPKRAATIAVVDPRLQIVMDYSYWGPFAKPLLWALNTIYDYVHNYGLAIIILTLLIKLLLLPFSLHGQKSMAKSAEFHRKMQYLQQKYQHDKEQLAHYQTALMKEHGVGGFLGGCLPMIINIPLFLALGKVLNTAIELYQAPFLWVPDLAQKDPYYIFPLLGALAISWSVVPMLASKQGSSSKPKNILPMVAFALIFTAFAAGLPAGLSLFMFMSAALGTLQTVLLKKYVKA